jgi:hypothetical protein
MKRVILLLAVASLPFAIAPTVAAPGTQSVSIVSSPATVPVSVSNSSPISVAVTNGTSAAAVNFGFGVTLGAGTNAGGADVWTNSGTAPVLITSLASQHNLACAATTFPVYVEIVSRPPTGTGTLSATATFTQVALVSDCRWLLNPLSGGVVIQPGGRLFVGVYLSGASSGGITVWFGASGYTL